MLWGKVSLSFIYFDVFDGMSRCDANLNAVNKKQLVKEVFQDEASGDEM
jgi:hypothetical protein